MQCEEIKQIIMSPPAHASLFFFFLANFPQQYRLGKVKVWCAILWMLYVTRLRMRRGAAASGDGDGGVSRSLTTPLLFVFHFRFHLFLILQLV